MLCYLRYPGRPLQTSERPPAALVSFVAEQIDVLPEAIDDYLAAQNLPPACCRIAGPASARPFRQTRRGRTRRRSSCRKRLRTIGSSIWRKLVMEECRRRRIVIPAPRRLERLCVDAPLSGAAGDRAAADRRAVARAAAAARCVDACAGRKPARAGSSGCAKCRKRQSPLRCSA